MGILKPPSPACAGTHPRVLVKKSNINNLSNPASDTGGAPSPNFWLTRVSVEELPEEAAQLLLAVPHEFAVGVRSVSEKALLRYHALARELGRALRPHLLVALVAFKVRPERACVFFVNVGV